MIYTGNPNNGLILAATLPDDATPIKASDVNVPLGVLLDDMAYLSGRGVVGVYEFVVDNTTLFIESFASTSYTAGSTVMLDIPAVAVGDLVSIDFQAIIRMLGGNANEVGLVRVSTTQAYGLGGAVTAILPGARAVAPDTDAMSNIPGYSVVAFGKLAVTVAGPLRIFIEGKVPTAGRQIDLNYVACLRATVLRPI